MVMVPIKEPNIVAITTPNADQLKPPVSPTPLPPRIRTRERTRTRTLDSQTSIIVMMRMKIAIKQNVRGIVSDAFDANCSNNFESLKSQCAAVLFIFRERAS